MRRASSSTLRRITSSAAADFRRIPGAGFQFPDHRDDWGEWIAQLVGKKGQKLVLRRVRPNQFLPQRHVAGLVFDEIKDALDRLLRGLETQQVYVHETRHSSTIEEGVFDELIRRSKPEDPLNRFARRDLHLVIGHLINVPALRQVAEPLCHVDERLVCLEKMARFRIDQRDSARHIRENLLVENYFALDSSRRFRLASGRLSSKPGHEGGDHDQPQRRDRDFIQQVPHRFVSDGFGCRTNVTQPELSTVVNE
jgi:hypothetical protein